MEKSYILKRIDGRFNLNFEWDGDLILFDNDEEINEYISKFPEYFSHIKYEIIYTEIDLSIPHIHYKDIRGI